MVDNGGFLGDAERVGQGEDLDGEADLDALGLGGDGGGADEGRGHDGAFRAEVGLADPKSV